MIKLFNLLLPVILTASVFAVVTFAACKQDKCIDISCQNGGSCNDGTCVCPDGYSGPRCETVDPCKDVVCLNQGKCDNGKCDCPFEYEGDSCQYQLRDKYAKTYEGTRRYGQGTAQPGWRLKFSKKGPDPKVMEVELLNLVGTVWMRYEINMITAGTFNIPRQDLKNSLVEGDGVISPNLVKVNLTTKSLPDTTKVYQEYYEMTAQ